MCIYRTNAVAAAVSAAVCDLVQSRVQSGQCSPLALPSVGVGQLKDSHLLSLTWCQASGSGGLRLGRRHDLTAMGQDGIFHCTPTASLLRPPPSVHQEANKDLCSA
ncbi:hypothetical protein EYF80_015181 [Liparis tanakae]|uniref:Uncharacterized protein n=1 Tax=Liparis tanakae TaxID=230148 RepID=A0A4Z2IBC8_9TELE|nr:hypothetical protein EYF80_015181 [Liparis tanakae]